MYEVISNIINHSWIPDATYEQDLVFFICGALIIILTIVFIDLIYRIFRHFWR